MTYVDSFSFIEYKSHKFVISNTPTDQNLSEYIKYWKRYHVTCLVRTCQQIYEDALVKNENINIIDLPFPDGSWPSHNILKRWKEIVSTYDNSCIAVHCVAGLGRAPLLVCIALINNGMKTIDAVELIRSKRKGSLNKHQLDFLMKYKSKEDKQTGCGCFF